MSERPAFRQFEATARKWRDLAERRRASFVEMYESGRWKHYYDERGFLFQMREVARIAEMWEEISRTPPAAPGAPPAVAHRERQRDAA